MHAMHDHDDTSFSIFYARILRGAHIASVHLREIATLHSRNRALWKKRSNDAEKRDTIGSRSRVRHCAQKKTYANPTRLRRANIFLAMIVVAEYSSCARDVTVRDDSAQREKNLTAARHARYDDETCIPRSKSSSVSSHAAMTCMSASAALRS
jgi:hypothetical protein